jgi:hypothetical protein
MPIYSYEITVHRRYGVYDIEAPEGVAEAGSDFLCTLAERGKNVTAERREQNALKARRRSTGTSRRRHHIRWATS